MMGRGMVFGKIVTKVTIAWAPINAELPLFESISDPKEMHVHGFGSSLLDRVRELFVSISFGRCTYPSSSKMIRMGTSSIALTKLAPTSDSAAEDMMCLRMMETVWSGPFFGIHLWKGDCPRKNFQQLRSWLQMQTIKMHC
jgi:hypothetical protein